MFALRRTLSVTTDGSGNATAYFDAVDGKVAYIRYVADGTTPYDNTVDFTFSGETTGINVLTIANVSASTTWYPVAPAVTVAAGGASTLTERPVTVAGERVKVVLAQGGATKVGQFYIVFE